MLKKGFLLFFISFYFSFTYADDYGWIKGSIKDSVTGDALPGVTVKYSDRYGTVSGANGIFNLKLQNGEQILTFSYIGYENLEKKFQIITGETIEVEIRLKRTALDLDVVVISASFYERLLSKEVISMEVIDKDFLSSNHTITLNEGLDRIPGVNVTDNQANIRGGSGWSYGAGSRVLILLDDMPMLSGDASDIKWDIIPIENAGSVEVVKGSASALYGTSALNGVINVRTAWPVETPYTNVEVFQGIYLNPKFENDNNYVKNYPVSSGARVVHRRQIHRFDLVTSAHYLHDESYLEGNRQQRAGLHFKTRYRFKNSPGLNAGLNGILFGSNGERFFLWAGADSLLYMPMQNTVAGFNNKRLMLDPFINYQWGKNYLDLKGRHYLTLNTDDADRGSRSEVNFGEMRYRREFTEKDMNLVSGISAYKANVRGPEADDDQSLYGEHESENLALYLQLDKTFFKKLNFTAGSRYEYTRIDTFESDARPLFRAGLNYHIAGETYFRASYGEGYRFPSVAEKFVRTNVGPIGIYPNYHLEPEEGWTAEAGLKQGFKAGIVQGFIDLSAYINRYNNMVEFTFGQHGDPFTDPMFGIGFNAQNAGDTRIEGIELTLAGKADFNVNTSMSFLAGFNHIKAVYLDWEEDSLIRAGSSSDENFLKYRSPQIIKADVQLQHKRFSAGFSAQYHAFVKAIDQTFIDFGRPPFSILLGEQSQAFSAIEDFREENNKGHILIDLRLAFKFSNAIEVSFLVKNLLDEVYMIRPAYLGAPRSLTGRMVVEF